MAQKVETANEHHTFQERMREGLIYTFSDNQSNQQLRALQIKEVYCLFTSTHLCSHFLLNPKIFMQKMHPPYTFCAKVLLL